MWAKALSDNFKELLDITTRKPLVPIVLVLIFLAGFFINKWAISKDNCSDDLKAKDNEILEINKLMYEYKYQVILYKTLYENNVRETDSLFNETNNIIKPILNNNEAIK